MSFMLAPLARPRTTSTSNQSRAARAGQAALPVPSGAVSYGVGSAPPAAVTRKRLPPPTAPGADNIGGLFNQVQQLQQEVMRLNGLVEQQAYELRSSRSRASSATSISTGACLRRCGADRLAVLGTAPVAAPGPRRLRRPRRREQPGEGEAYRSAYALVRGQEFDAAVRPSAPSWTASRRDAMLPNAHYWLGELYLVVDPPDPGGGAPVLHAAAQSVPGNAKVPDALYKLGRVHFIKGNSDRAREFLNRVIREYPDSSAARLASDFLDQNL
jgi:TolA-binding protein